MSRNLGLLTQIELESTGSDTRARAAVDQCSLKDVNARDAGGEEMLRLVQRVFLSGNESGSRQVVFCGVDGDSGSGSVCASAGRVLATSSLRSVCLVDANVRSSCLSGILGVDTTIPFSGKSASLRDRCVQIKENLWLAGADMVIGNGGSLRSAEELKRLLAQLLDVFEYVLIDAPGASTCGDAALLGRVSDAVILVIEANSTRRLTARRAKENLEAAGVRLLGTVLHNRSFPIPEALYKRL